MVRGLAEVRKIKFRVRLNPRFKFNRDMVIYFSGDHTDLYSKNEAVRQTLADAFETQAILISGSSQMQYSDHFKADHVFSTGEILSFAGDRLELNIDAMNARLGVPVEKKKKPQNTAGSRANNVKKLLEEIKTEISGAYSHYCNQNYRDNGSLELYPRLTFEQLGERFGISKGTVSKIFSEKDENGNPAYKELHIMWEVLGLKEQILKYGMKHLQNKQKGR